MVFAEFPFYVEKLKGPRSGFQPQWHNILRLSRHCERSFPLTGCYDFLLVGGGGGWGTFLYITDDSIVLEILKVTLAVPNKKTTHLLDVKFQAEAGSSQKMKSWKIKDHRCASAEFVHGVDGQAPNKPIGMI